MSFIQINFDDAVEPTIAPAGRYNLQITECKVVKTGEASKTPGMPQFRVNIGFPENPEYQNFSHFIGIPNELDDATTATRKALGIKRFAALFNIPLDRDGIDTERFPMEAVGAGANAEITLSEPNADGNVYNGLKVPRLRGEGGR